MRPRAKRLAVAAGLMAVVLSAAGSALAHDDDEGYGWKKHHRGPPFVPPGHTYYVERPVVLVPARPVYPERSYYGGYGYGGYGGGGYGGQLPPPSININIPLQ
jgi:hypothetical protein